MKGFLHDLKPLKRKLTAERFLCWLIRLLAAAALVSIVMAVLSYFFFLDKWKACGIAFAVAALGAGAAALIFLRVDMKQTAEAADRLGAQERMITTLELLERQERTPMEELAVKDGLRMAGSVNFAKRYKISFSKRELRLSALLLCVMVLALYLIPPKQAEASAYTEAQIKKIEKTLEQIQTREDIEQTQKDAFAQAMKGALKELEQAKTQKDAELATRQIQQELKQLEKQSVSKDLQKLSEALHKTQAGEELARAAANADAEAMAQAMSELMKMLSSLSAEQTTSLASALSRAASQMDDAALKEALEAMAEALENGEIDLEALQQQLSEAMAGAAATNSAYRQGLQSLNAALGTTSSAAAQSGTQAENAAGEGNGEGEGNGTAEGSGSGEGSGTGEGSGSGGGQGSGTGVGSGRGFGHAEPEKIFSRNAAEKAGYDTRVDGADTQNGSITQSQQQIIGSRGESIAYEQVYESYRNDAMKAMEESNVPYGMREMVAEYFSTLEK